LSLQVRESREHRDEPAPLALDRTEHGGAERSALPGLALALAGVAAAAWAVYWPGWR